MFKRRNSSRTTRYRGGGGLFRRLLALRKRKVSHGPSFRSKWGIRHVGQRGKDPLYRRFWKLLQEKSQRKGRRLGQTPKRKRKIASVPRLLTPQQGHQGKKRHSQKKNPPVPDAKRHFGKKRKQKPQAEVAQRPRHIGNKRGKSGNQPKSTLKSPYRSKNNSKKYNRSKFNFIAPKKSYQGGTKKRKYHKKDSGFLHLNKSYQGGNLNKKYKVKAITAYKLHTPYRSGSGKRFKVAKVHKVNLLSPYRTSGKKKGIKSKATQRKGSGVPYRSGLAGKKYKIKSKSYGSPLLQNNYKKTKGNKHESVSIQRKFMIGNSYRAGGRVYKYKVKSVKKVKISQRKHSATAARSKKMQYLQKTATGKKRSSKETRTKKKKVSVHNHLKRFALFLSILVVISLFIFYATRERWMAEPLHVSEISQTMRE